MGFWVKSSSYHKPEFIIAIWFHCTKQPFRPRPHLQTPWKRHLLRRSYTSPGSLERNERNKESKGRSVLTGSFPSPSHYQGFALPWLYTWGHVQQGCSPSKVLASEVWTTTDKFSKKRGGKEGVRTCLNCSAKFMLQQLSQSPLMQTTVIRLPCHLPVLSSLVFSRDFSHYYESILCFPQ